MTGYETIRKLLNSPQTFKKHKLEITTNKITQLLIKGLVIQNNLKQQVFKIRDKVINEIGIGSKKKTALLGTLINNKLKELKKRSDSTTNYVTTLSRERIAQLLNRKSKSTGARIMKKFKHLNLVEKDIRRKVFLTANVYKESYHYFVSLYGGKVFMLNGCLYRRVSNEISISVLSRC